MDILSEYGNMNIMLGEGNTNSIEKELDSIIDGPEGQQDLQCSPNKENVSHENEIGDIENRISSIRHKGLSESMNIFPDEMNARFSAEMGSLMDLKQSLINRAISSAINSRVSPEIQITIGSLPLNCNGPQPCTSLNEDGIGNA